MKTKLRTPFFEIGVKNYVYGDEVLKIAKVADECAKKYDVDVIFVAPYTEIWRVSRSTERLAVFAPYMDTLRPGRGMADVLPEALKAAGAQGVVLNHCERPMSLGAVKEAIKRANELDLLTFVCADTIEEAMAVAQLSPDIINTEESGMIGSGQISSMDYVLEAIQAIKSINPSIIVEQAAGITTGSQVYDLISAGVEATGAASGIFKADNPSEKVEEMISAVSRARGKMCSGKENGRD